MGNKEIIPNAKREHPVRGAMLCSCKARKGSTLNPQSNCRSQPRAFSCLSSPLASVYEKLLDAGSIRPLTPTQLPKVLPASHNPSHYCTYHQMPGHSTNACFRLRHAVQDLIDNGIIPAPLPSKPDDISNPLSQLKSDLLVGQISITSTQINPASTQINPSSTIFNPSRYIVPANQPKPIVSLSSEPEVNLMAIGATEVFTADTWMDSDEEPAKGKFKRKLNQSKEETDWLRSFNHESLGLLFKEFSQVGLAEEAKEAEVLLLGPNILPLCGEAKGNSKNCIFKSRLICIDTFELESDIVPVKLSKV